MFETNRLLIRPYSKSDKVSLYNTISRYEVYRTTYGIPQNCTVGYAAKWINSVLQNARENRSYEYAVINKLNGEYIGNVGLINVDFVSRKCDISYFIHPDFWNKGFATEAAVEMVKYSFNVLDMNRVGGMCMARNTASAKVMEKLLITLFLQLYHRRRQRNPQGVYHEIKLTQKTSNGIKDQSAAFLFVDLPVCLPYRKMDLCQTHGHQCHQHVHTDIGVDHGRAHA